MTIDGPEHDLFTAAPCPCCGGLTNTTLAVAPPLLAVCDVLVVKALDQLGRRMMRHGRARFQQLDGRPFYLAHTLWPPDEETVMKKLSGAWDVIPALLGTTGIAGVTAADLTLLLDRYVRDLAITGTPHDVTELRWRLEHRLGIPLPDVEPYQPGALA